MQDFNPLKQITDDVKIGRDVIINSFVNLYGCEIGAESMIGPFVEIQRDVIIGKRVRIQSHSFICEQVTLEDEVFIGHGVMFINDKYPAVPPVGQPKPEWDKTLVCKGASIGSNATILGNITIGKHALVGAGSVVTKDVPPYTVVAGNPAQFIRKIEKE